MTSSTRQRLAAAALVASGLTTSLAACAGDDEDSVRLTIFAASSLTESFDRLAVAFEEDHPGVAVVITYGSSSTLAEQINQGAPTDVIATADERSIDSVAAKGLLTGRPTLFATNSLVLVTPANNQAHVTTPDDLATADFVACDPSAPCGAAAAEFLAKTGISADPKSLEPDVKSVLAKVTLGEADAGVVYVTDGKAAGDKVTTIPIPSNLNVVNPYFIGIVKNSTHIDITNEWVSLVESRAGQSVLADAGFTIQ